MTPGKALVEKRRPLTRVEIITLAVEQNGRCGCGCGEKLDAVREGVIDEHRIPLELTGANDLSNRALYRKPCAVKKTKDDHAAIAKCKRLAGELKSDRYPSSAWFAQRSGRGSDGCINWMRHRTSDGYGRLRWQGQTWLAHRLAWSSRFGEIPDGMAVCHRCDNPACVNADHLFVGTWGDNNRDRAAKGRSRTACGEDSNLSSITEDQALKIIALCAIEPNAQRIADAVACGVSAVHAVRSGSSWKHIERGDTSLWPKMGPGEANASAKLTEDQAREAIRLVEDEGLTHVEVAMRLGVKKTTIGALVNGRSWPHLPRTKRPIRSGGFSKPTVPIRIPSRPFASRGKA